jgi:hypothetical protein
MRLIEKLERLNNYTLISQLIQMRVLQKVDLINLKMTSKESVWLLMQDGMTKLVLQSLRIQESLVHSI